MQGYDSLADHAISIWIPFVSVGEKSGCLQVIPGSHRRGIRPEIRVARNNLISLPSEEVEDLEPVSCAMAPGDMLLFTERLFHRSLDNMSDYTRWSLDIHYFNAGNEALSGKERERYTGSGYYCFSASGSQRGGSYEAWALTYESDGEF